MPAITVAELATSAVPDAVVVGVLPGARGPRLAPGAGDVDAALGRRLSSALRVAGATGLADDVVKIPTLGRAAFGLVIATGLGAGPRTDEQLRRAVGAAVRQASGHAHVHLAIDGSIEALAEGALLGCYEYTAYKSQPVRARLRTVTIRESGAAGESRKALRRARTVADAVNEVRDLVNAPPNDLYPETFAARAAQLAGNAGLAVEVLDVAGLRRGGYGGILGVGGGSARGPRLVQVSYRPSRPRTSVALVGKGITYDSGGINLKTANLTWMKSDMAGAAVMLAATVAAAALRLPVAITATLPMAENMPSGSAYHPSDVLQMRNGRTVEVADTDAEGRLILADGISRALQDEPEHLIEASTLTGAQMIALGPRVIGAMGEPGLRDRVVRAGTAAGESIWAMPLPPDLRPGLDSPVADLVNVPTERWGAMLVGGLFLSAFVPAGQSWVHLDIAGPAFNAAAAHDYTPRGGTGAGVRTVIASLADLAAR